MKIGGYGLCTGGSEDLEKAQDNLTNEVVKKLADGWIPQGGVSYSTAEVVKNGFRPCTLHVFTQAVVKPA